MNIRYQSQPPRTVDVAIVGGGIIGAATAFYAARAGLSAVVLEARPRLATLTTPVSTGAFRLQFDNPEELALVREGVELFEEFSERAGMDGWDLALQHGGYLFCALTAEAHEQSRRLVERQRGWGLDDVELLDGDEARRRFPYLSGDVVAARYRARDGWLDPRRLALGYATAASNPERIPDRELGAARPALFCVDTPVHGFLRSAAGDRITGVETSKGAVAAAHVIIAAGPFTGVLAAQAGVSLEIRPTRRHKLTFPELPDVPPDAPMTIEIETGAHWRPAMRGCFALWTERDTPPSEPQADVPTSADWAFRLLDPSSDSALARVSPFWARVWERSDANWLLQAGQYEYTPDHRPYLGPSAVPGLAINGGYSGHGIMASAGGSRLTIDLLLERADSAAGAFAVHRARDLRERDVL
ncbi:MAG: FAD-binding oxidoreductase [Chloroflexi bacterium]|nr:FAD-binding oxidoreductase [Chloroflexota bacterium]